MKSLRQYSDAQSVAIVPIENSIGRNYKHCGRCTSSTTCFAHGEIHLDINFGLYATRTQKIENIKRYTLSHHISQTKPIHSKHQFSYDYVESTIQGLEKSPRM